MNNEILHKEEINLDEALGKVSMEEILSEEDMPGYRSSVMDGYALGESTKGNNRFKFYNRTINIAFSKSLAIYSR